MTNALRFTSADLELVPDDGKRYEIIDGELFVSWVASWEHQLTCGQAWVALHNWNQQTGIAVAVMTPGLIFSPYDAVIPDIVWVRRERVEHILRSDGKLHGAPDLVVEILSPGSDNERRDREFKLKLYSRQGVREYWLLDSRERRVEVYRRVEAQLHLAATLHADDTLTSPLLPGFACPVRQLFPEPA